MPSLIECLTSQYAQDQKAIASRMLGSLEDRPCACLEIAPNRDAGVKIIAKLQKIKSAIVKNTKGSFQP
jgi:hypothetical protein